MMYVLNSPHFSVFLNFISISGQNSVKILTNLYTWRHCELNLRSQAKSKSDNLLLMIFNCRGLHYIAKNVNERVKLIPDELKDYDIIGLQEASGSIK